MEQNNLAISIAMRMLALCCPRALPNATRQNVKDLIVRYEAWCESHPELSLVDDDDEDDDADDEPPVEHELPQYWRDLESRTVNRKPRVDGPRGRGPRRKREEDYWQEAGLYDKPRNE